MRFKYGWMAILLWLAMCGIVSAEDSITGEMFKGELMVPAKAFFERNGFGLDWDQNKQLVKVKKDQITGVLKPGYPQFIYGGRLYSLVHAPYIKDGSLFIPLRACAEAIGLHVSWDESAKAAEAIGDGLAFRVEAPAPAQAVSDAKAYYFEENINGIQVQGVRISPPFCAELVLGGDYVGGTESLSSMAERTGAIAAINGSFFDAYTDRPEPYNNLVRGGRFIHMGEQGTTIGFTRDGRAQIAPVKFKVEGAINGSYQWPNNWYAYGFNHTPEGNGVYIYTPERGEYTGVEEGISVVVAGGKVVQKLNGDAPIPQNGYVIKFTGQEESLADRFQIGKRVDYKIGCLDARGQSWNRIITAVGGGPRLLTKGRVTIDAVGEGFEEEKIISGSATRSAIGITRDGAILLIIVPSATMEELAGIMQQLGAVDAMNLDGGASTGLWFKGSTISEPGRLLSNALIFK